MMWVDYTIDQVGKNFKVKGDWEGEVMGCKKMVHLKIITYTNQAIDL